MALTVDINIYIQTHIHIYKHRHIRIDLVDVQLIDDASDDGVEVYCKIFI